MEFLIGKKLLYVNIPLLLLSLFIITEFCCLSLAFSFEVLRVLDWVILGSLVIDMLFLEVLVFYPYKCV